MSEAGSSWDELIGLSKEQCERSYLMRHTGGTFDQASLRTYSDGTSVYSFYEKGLSFGFLKDGTLDSIDFYNDKTSGGVRAMKTVADSVPLPFGITKQDTGRSLVTKFGEPKEKGGGFNAKIDIWLRWDNFQVDIDNKSWDQAPNSRWSAFTIYRP
ncbi:unnamed protein product [Kuraishia capsulata CBS 1993]|uniref:Uncharacterized protein n=1 Tax=Kuraishia capsulata CBS 1993 TaxID=1382522 RepID=W6MFG2_9ASCO|nr:uncharacterized protein KUCA_T00000281001 [Kuraishia capsulata CBS 1993]CDK24321.1 unnamed protein product [Kuraishia capsulata CBS 1993]